MDWLSNLRPSEFLVFTLVLIRLSGVVVTAPFLGGPEVPARVRVYLALALAMLIAPTQLSAAEPSADNLVGLATLAIGELLVGLTLGLGVMVLLVGAQLAGGLIAHLSGMSLADVFQPGFDDSIPLFSQVLYLVSLTIFLLLDGHRLVVGGLLDTFAAFPPGEAALPLSASDTFTRLVGHSFVLGIRTAAPVMAAQLLGTLVLGLISRTLPQLNVLVLGFGINALVTLSMLMLTLGGLAWVLESQVGPLLELVFELVAAPLQPPPLESLP